MEYLSKRSKKCESSSISCITAYLVEHFVRRDPKILVNHTLDIKRLRDATQKKLTRIKERCSKLEGKLKSLGRELANEQDELEFNTRDRKIGATEIVGSVLTLGAMPSLMLYQKYSEGKYIRSLQASIKEYTAKHKTAVAQREILSDALIEYQNISTDVTRLCVLHDGCSSSSKRLIDAL